MNLRRCVVGACLSLSIAMLVWLWQRPSNAPVRVRLPNGEEMRVLKVSLGTNHFLSLEPFWKRCLRRILPEVMEKPLGPLQAEQTKTRWDTLVVWLEGPPLSARTSFTVENPQAIFTNGVTMPGRKQGKQGLVRLTFPCFERESRLIPLKVRHETNSVLFYVNNPAPAAAATWKELPLPQTQHVHRANVVFTRFRSNRWDRTKALQLQPSIFVRGNNAPYSPVVYWWRATAFDRWGNYSEGRYNGEPPQFAPLPAGRGPWRILMEGEEYLSAGFIPYPSNELALLLPLTPRMQQLGIRFLMLAGPGVHTISNNHISSPAGSSYGAVTSGISMFHSGSGSNEWALQFSTRVPGVLCVSELLPDIPHPRMRLHERDLRREGRTIPAKALFSATNSGVRCLAQFFAPPLPARFTNRFEVEMISDIATDFFVKTPDQ